MAYVSFQATANAPGSTAANGDLPAGVVAGQIALMIVGWENQEAAPDVTWPAGTTDLGQSFRNPGASVAVGYKTITAGEVTAGEIAISLTQTDESSVHIYTYSGVQSIAVVYSDGVTANPDPANLVFDGDEWVAGAAIDADRTFSAYSSGYTGGVTTQSSGNAATAVTLASARKTATAASEDPGQMTASALDDWRAFTVGVAFGPSVTAADGTVQIGEAGLTHDPVPSGTEVFTASPAFSSAISGATLDPGGAAIDITSLLSSLSTTSATLTAPDVSLFRVGGAWNAIRWGVDYVIRFTDGTDTADVNCRFTAPVPTRFGAIVTPNATYHPGAAIATDESYGLFTVGEGTHDPADGDTTANVFVAGSATFQPFAYDISAGAWIEGTSVNFVDPNVGTGINPLTRDIHININFNIQGNPNG